MAEPKTREELVARVLERLGAGSEGDAPAAEDAARVDRSLDSTLATLAARGIVYVGDPDAVALEVFEPVALLIANEMKTDFGGAPIDPLEVGRAESILRLINSSGPTYETMQVDYF